MVQGHNSIDVEVIYALPGKTHRVTLEISKDGTVEQAIKKSGVLEIFPEIDLARNKVGIFSHTCSLDHRLMDGDRVEIYRPLKVDPKEARRRRQEKRNSSS